MPLAGVWGADRVGMHLAPRMDSHDMGDSDALATFTYVGRELGKRGPGFHLRPRSAEAGFHRPRHQGSFRRRLHRQ